MQLEKKHTGTGTHAHLASSAYPIRMTHLHVPFACPMHVPSALPICMSHSHVPLHPICMSHPHFPFACPICMSECISHCIPCMSHLHVPFACPIASNACRIPSPILGKLEFTTPHAVPVQWQDPEGSICWQDYYAAGPRCAATDLWPTMLLLMPPTEKFGDRN